MHLRNYGAINSDARQQAIAFFQQGLPNPEIAQRLGVDRVTVYRWRKRADMMPRKTEKAPTATKIRATQQQSDAVPEDVAPIITVKLPPEGSSSNRDIGQRLVFRRQKAEIFRTTAAKRLGVSDVGVLYSYEGGHRGTPIRVLGAASKAYNVSLDWLITGREHVDVS